MWIFTWLQAWTPHANLCLLFPQHNCGTSATPRELLCLTKSECVQSVFWDVAWLISWSQDSVFENIPESGWVKDDYILNFSSWYKIEPQEICVLLPLLPLLFCLLLSPFLSFSSSSSSSFLSRSHPSFFLFIHCLVSIWVAFIYLEVIATLGCIYIWRNTGDMLNQRK